MKQKRLRDKLFKVWLNQKELDFLTEYSERHLMTASELVRHWLHQAMKKEGVLEDVSLKEKEIKPKNKK